MMTTFYKKASSNSLNVRVLADVPPGPLAQAGAGNREDAVGERLRTLSKGATL